MEERPKLSLERYREIVPEWSPRPPMTERRLIDEIEERELQRS